MLVLAAEDELLRIVAVVHCKLGQVLTWVVACTPLLELCLQVVESLDRSVAHHPDELHEDDWEWFVLLVADHAAKFLVQVVIQAVHEEPSGVRVVGPVVLVVHADLVAGVLLDLVQRQAKMVGRHNRSSPFDRLGQARR